MQKKIKKNPIMKKPLLTLLFLLISLTFFAQASFTSMGIAVQGIARDNQNNKYNAKKITLEFQFFYYEGSGNATTRKDIGGQKFKEITTDDFGVFSTIIDDYGLNNSDFSNHKLWISIKVQGDTNPLQETQLMHVPYAISANNGVPTGSIMPFIGTKDQVPEGWLLCNGEPIISDTKTKNLIALLGGTNTPNLQGTFLRGTGISPINNQAGPGLREGQEDENKSHSHDQGTLEATNAGKHKHKTIHLNDDGNDTEGSHPHYKSDATLNSNPLHVVEVYSEEAGEHKHGISGSVGFTGDTESRPVNYGVNYIIKL
jgi:microcystin-dependent protein